MTTQALSAFQLHTHASRFFPTDDLGTTRRARHGHAEQGELARED